MLTCLLRPTKRLISRRAVILIPAAAVAGYSWPEDNFVYIFAEHYPLTFRVSLNGENMTDVEWEGTAVNISTSSFVHFSKKTVGGLGFEMGISVNGRGRFKAHYSIFEGNYFWIYVHMEVMVIQAETEPPRPGQMPG